MRYGLALGTALAASLSGAGVAQTQSAGFAWCVAKADNGAGETLYYSQVFPYTEAEIAAKAAAFKAEAEEAETSAATMSGSCNGQPNQAAAQASRDAAMKAAPGEALDWAG